MFDIKKIPNGGVWIPSSEERGNWVIIAMHGSGGSGSDFQGLENILQFPEMNYLYLNGPILEYSNFRWYTEAEGSRQTALNYIEYAINQLIESGFSREKIFLIGFSQGGALVFEFGLRYPYLLAGYIAISGRIENLPALISQKNPLITQKGRWLVTHGKKDYNLSVDVIRMQVKKLQDAGLKIDFREYDKIHEFDRQKEMPEIRSWISKIIHS